MNHTTRMSPWTAFFIGLFMLGGMVVGSGTLLIMRGMSIFEHNVARVVDFAQVAIEDLPQTIKDVSPLISEFVGERNLDYAKNIGVTVKLAQRPGTKTLRPALQVTNKGNQPINFMTIRVAALTAQNLPVAEWTEVVATPIGIENDWRGPLVPNQTRYVVMRNGWDLPADYDENVTLAYEIVEVFVPEAIGRTHESHVGTN